MYTPRKMRRKNNASRNGTVDGTKSKAFRKAAQMSKLWIHQSSSYLEHPRNYPLYRDYCGKCDRDGLRKG